MMPISTASMKDFGVKFAHMFNVKVFATTDYVSLYMIISYGYMDQQVWV